MGSHFYRLSNIPEINAEKLIYFAISIFWRAATHTWKTGKGTVKIELGAHTDALRRFLMGGQFPENDAHLFVRLLSSEILCMRMNEPASKNLGGYCGHKFALLGFDFTLMLGKRIPDRFRNTSTAPAGVIVVSDKLDKENLDGLVEKVRITLQ